MPTLFFSASGSSDYPIFALRTHQVMMTINVYSLQYSNSTLARRSTSRVNQFHLILNELYRGAYILRAPSPHIHFKRNSTTLAYIAWCHPLFAHSTTTHYRSRSSLANERGDDPRHFIATHIHTSYATIAHEIK